MGAFSNNSSNWSLRSLSSIGAIGYGALDMGAVPDTRSIVNSTFFVGGKPWRSSGNTSRYSQTMGMSSSFGLAFFSYDGY